MFWPNQAQPNSSGIAGFVRAQLSNILRNMNVIFATLTVVPFSLTVTGSSSGANMAVPSKLDLYKKNDQVVKFTGLQDAISLAYLNAATVTATLVDSKGVTVTGFNALPCSYIASSNGDYQLQIVGTAFDPPVGSYTMKLVGVQAGADNIELEIRTSVKTRKT